MDEETPQIPSDGEAYDGPIESDDPPKSAPKRPRRAFLGLKPGCWVILILSAGLTVWLGPIIRDGFISGYFQALIWKGPQREYAGTTTSNLKDMHRALMLYHESEDRFPFAEGWMDEIELRLQAGDMSKAESQKRMVSPEFAGQTDKYGYAFNDLASGKYKDDVPEPAKTPLVFDSRDLTRNAHGSPEELLPIPPRNGRNQGISVSGSLIRL
jgi:hypothetical protein